MKKSVLFVGQAYYNAWYLSRELKKIGWKADVLNYDNIKRAQMYYHGEDFRFFDDNYIMWPFSNQLYFFINAINTYEIFHFSNMNGIYFINKYDELIKKKQFGNKERLDNVNSLIFRLLVYLIAKYLSISNRKLKSYIFSFIYKIITKYYGHLPLRWDIYILKYFGKKIVYSNNGCLDGVSKTSFSKWLPENVCRNYCNWNNKYDVCNDEKNLTWGKFRNSVADYQCLLGGNRVDYNISPKIHESPWFYCLDAHFWKPDLLIPANYLLPIQKSTVKIYHSIGNFEARTNMDHKNIKCTHIYIPLVERYKNEGLDVELIFFNDVKNKKLRYYQLQADIFVDMLTFGFFGANIREGMMLGKPCICYLRPEWLEQMREEIPEYVDELPVVSATPDTIYEVLKDLIVNPDKRRQIGKRSREFAVKWHSSKPASSKFDIIYRKLLEDNC